MRGHSVGGYGSVTTNKVIATIAGEVFGMDVQAYPKYGSEKKGLPTTYYLTIAKKHIRVHSELEHVEFIPLNDVNAFNLENPLAGLAENGIVFVQSHETDPSKIWSAIPAWARKTMINRKARLFALDVVTGERITIYLAEDRSVVEGGQQERVKAVFYPRPCRTAATCPRNHLCARPACPSPHPRTRGRRRRRA